MASHKGDNEEYFEKKKKIDSKVQFYSEVWPSKDQSCKKLVSRKKHLKFFFHDV